jgi:hypothetical protein
MGVVYFSVTIYALLQIIVFEEVQIDKFVILISGHLHFG